MKAEGYGLIAIQETIPPQSVGRRAMAQSNTSWKRRRGFFDMAEQLSLKGIHGDGVAFFDLLHPLTDGGMTQYVTDF